MASTLAGAAVPELITIVGVFILLFYLPYVAHKACARLGTQSSEGHAEGTSRRLSKEPRVDHVGRRYLGLHWGTVLALAPQGGKWVFKLPGAATPVGVGAIAFHQRGTLSPVRPS